MEDIEIKRKFLPKSKIDLTNLRKESFERYYLYRSKESEIRIQKIDDKYEIERLVSKSELSRAKQKWEITKDEFETLKGFSKEAILRDSYLVSADPEIKVRIYHGRFEGLTRIEVGFRSEEEAARFTPLDWFGKEITNTPLWRDSELLELSDDDFKQLIS